MKVECGPADRGQVDRRREPRFETRLWVGIPDVDGEPELESCNISAAGMLLRTRRDAGAPGAVRMLRLVTADLGVEIEIMARVVRVVATEDAEWGRVIEATGFEFLPHQPQELEDFLQEALAVEMSVAAAASVNPRVPACVSALSVSGMVIDINRAVEAGSRIWVEIEMPSSRSATRFSGRAVQGRPIENAGDEPLYRIEVGFDGELEDEPGEERGDSRVSDPASTPSSEASPGRYSRERKGVHMSGTLSEVGLPSLLGFFELERASGVLRLEQDSKTAILFVRDGGILDVESVPTAPSATEALASLLEWPDGAFEFTFQSVERADAIGTPTTALLMDFARRSDESSRQP
jgi:hypothetical protein